MTSCVGVDSDGISITTDRTTVDVRPGAVVQGAISPAIAVEIAPSTSSYTARTATIAVAGQVSGGSQNGVGALSGPVPANSFDFYGTRATVTIAASGSVTGANGIVVGASPGNSYGPAIVTVDNSGSIIGTNGFALLATSPAVGGFASITNRIGASMGAISGPVGTLTNAGTIDGGSRSAIDGGTTYNPYIGSNGVANSGTIRSSSNDAAIVNSGTLNNSGTVINTVGVAIGEGFAAIVNATGGRIAGGGGTAIAAGAALNLTNAGRVDGNVTAVSTSSFVGPSTIDSTAGTIAGDVTLGVGSDTVVARYASGALVTGITGAIDGGAGTDTLRVRFDEDVIVSSPIALPIDFERLALAPLANVTATLGSGFDNTGTILLAGPGTVVNRGTLQGTDQVIVDEFGTYSRFINEGTIRSTATDADLYAMTLRSISFANAGTIDAAANGVSLSSRQSFSNSGAITAAGVGLDASFATVNNSGILRSTGGVALNQFGSQTTNTGTIEGASAGVSLFSGTIVNSGRIAATSGIGVQMQGAGLLDNRAGGVVSGTTAAIGPVPGSFNILTSTSVSNAGTIDGNVILTSGPSFITTGNNRFFALPGGVLNGDLTLGSGDFLVTQIANTGPGQFAGITGTVTASNADLRYQVRSDATASHASATGFRSVGYELFDGATLTLTASGAAAPRATFAGSGTVDLTATIAVTDTPAISVTSLLTAQYYGGGPIDLSITSRGDISLVRTDQNTYPYAAVAFGGTGTFTNAGTITVREQLSTAYGSVGAIAGGTIVNSGTINLSGAIGVRAATQLTNSGSILQIAGGAAATGVSDVARVINTGTIQVGGVAITNSDYTYTPTTITNAAGGTIAGGGDTAVRLYSGSFTNAGTVSGTVDLGYSQPSYQGAPTRSYASSAYIAAGGTIAGDLLFGNGADLLLQTGEALGVSGIVEGGEGIDIFGRSLATSGTVAIDAVGVRGFEDRLVQAIGAGTTVTATATDTVSGNLYAVGDGSIVNQAAITGALTTEPPYQFTSPYSSAAPVFPVNQRLVSLTNAGTVAGGVTAVASAFTNTGSISTSAFYSPTVLVQNYDTGLSFTNSGTIDASSGSAASGYATVRLDATSSLSIANSGQIAGGLDALLFEAGNGMAAQLAFTNSGTVTSSTSTPAVDLWVFAGEQSGGGTIRVDNGGTISAQGTSATGGSATGLQLYVPEPAGPYTYALTNSGTIAATAAPGRNGAARQATGLSVIGTGMSGTITNAAGGTISAGGGNAYALIVADTALDLTNAGTISVSGTPRSAAVSTFDAFADSVTNTGTITGDVVLGGGADRVDNAGTITGAVLLGDGDDGFTHRAGGSVSGLVDGGAGNDSYVVDASGGSTSLDASGLANFERLTQVGTGTGNYSGTFAVDTIALAGGTLAVVAGRTLATAGATSVTGTGAAGVGMTNAGTIAGSIVLGEGDDIVANSGTIGGAVQLGGGNDTYVEGVNGVSAASVDGGTGTNLYRVVLAGDRTGIGARTSFQNLAVTGSGTLGLALDQSFDTVAADGAGLSLALGGYTVGHITGSGPAVQVAVDGDVAAVQFGAGNDTLAIGAATLAGRYDGGAGADTLRLTAAGSATLAGSATGFETLSLAGSALTITGTLGAPGQSLTFAGGDKTVTVARGGVLAGTVDLGAGNDSLRLASGAVLSGTVFGGSGSNVATLALDGGAFVLRARSLTGFGRVNAEGSGTLTLTDGALATDTLSVPGDLVIAADASLTSRVAFGPADNRMVVAGGFTGSVDGGAGTDSIEVSGGSAAAPVAFSSITGVEAYRMSGGFATVAGSAALGGVTLTGGRLVGLSGSTLTAATFAVGQGATFGSAGTVNGNLAVAGTLSPGASPGTMTVNGNVALTATSTSVFEITPTVSDKLVVNGQLSIASGATLQLVPSGTIAPGTILDLVTASGGITGSFIVNKPASLFGFVVQDAARIRLLGQFLGDASFSPQAGRSIDYVNGVLGTGRASAALLAAAPSLVTASGASNATLFAQLTPEAYASARQIAVENGLSAVDAARGAAFAPTREDAGAFVLASGLAATRTLDGDTARGTTTARTNGYGFVGELGWGSAVRSVGAFVGYQNDRQRLAALGARTNADGVVAGLQARMASPGGLGAKLTVAYGSGTAHTTRAVTGGSTSGNYDLKSWTADVAVDHAVPLGAHWLVRPGVGATVIRSSRGAVTESGNAAFGLSVARDRDTAVFVDGGLTFAGVATTGGAQVRPHLSLGLRYQASGRDPVAIGALGGGAGGLLAEGAGRAPVLATASLGIDVALSQRLTLFGAISGESGDADHRGAVRAGLSLGF